MLRFLKKIIQKILRSVGIEIASEWKSSIDLYKELRALKFATREDIDKAIGFLYSPKLQECPFDLVGDNTIIVPMESVKFFQEAGFKFVDTRVIPSGELTPEERYELRKKQGVF